VAARLDRLPDEMEENAEKSFPRIRAQQILFRSSGRTCAGRFNATQIDSGDAHL
jgi:hypothetical protein